jgi:hypothetical protein
MIKDSMLRKSKFMNREKPISNLIRANEKAPFDIYVRVTDKTLDITS